MQNACIDNLLCTNEARLHLYSIPNKWNMPLSPPPKSSYDEQTETTERFFLKLAPKASLCKTRIKFQVS